MGTELKYGDSGGAVVALQRALNGYFNSIHRGDLTTKDDGKFGPLTELALRRYQDAMGLTRDGVFGPLTRAKLFPLSSAADAPPVLKRGNVKRLTDDQVLARALGCIGAPIIYHLEVPNGGTDPEAPMPCDEHTGMCDCSGFNAWVHGFDRYQPPKLAPRDFPFWDGYINTDSKIAEAEGPASWFSIVSTPEPGDMIIGETFRTLLGKKVIGHEGTIVETTEWKSKGLAGIQVVHCSPSNYNRPGNMGHSAVWKTNGTIWQNYKKWRFVRYNRERILKLKGK